MCKPWLVPNYMELLLQKALRDQENHKLIFPAPCPER